MRRPLLLFIILLFSRPVFTVDYAALVAESDRRTNPDLITLMSENGLETALEIAAALGRRDDRYAGDVIAYFLHHYHARKAYEAERIIAALLSSLFPSNLTETDVRERLTLNGEIMRELIDGLETYETPDLRAECLRLTGRSGAASLAPLLARTGERMIRRLRSTGGRLTIPEYEEILIFFEAVERAAYKELKTSLAEIARWAADRRVVERAREILRFLP